MAAKRALLGPALAVACCLALAASPAAAQSASKRKPVENPVSAFFDRITAPPTAKKPARKTAKKPAASAAAKTDGITPPAKPNAATQAQVPIPEPRPTQPASGPVSAPPPNPTATVYLAPAAAHAVTPPVQASRPATTPAVRGDRLATAAAPPPVADKALLLSAEPVRMAKDAWAPQTRAAMFATEPTFAAGVFPPLGSRLAAVAPIELRTPQPNDGAAPRGAAAAPGIPLPRPAPTEAEIKLAALPTPEPPEPDTACINLLAAGIESTPAEALAGEGDCGARFPVKVVAFVTDEGRVTLDPPAVMRCGMARAVAKWVKESVSPTAKAKLGAELRSIRNASSYVCRPRNGVAGAKLSEHGRANALDISAFVLTDGRAVTVGTEVGEDLAFASEVRTAACLYLHTVLGPGSDASHADHLHVDMAHRGKNGDSRFCK